MDSQAYILEINGLTKRYDGFSLQDIHLKIEPGTITGLVGANGAGKSTTLKLILNLIRRDAGEIRVFGMDNVEQEAAIKQRIGVVFDEPCFHELLTAGHIGRYMSGLYAGWDEALFARYLQEFSLPENKAVKEFSRGMKMKLSLAVALSHNAKLLILDEPTSGLDPVVRSEILDIFLEFISDGERSILVSSHITSDLERIADYITFIHQGKVLLSENKDEILYGYGIAKAGREQLHRVDRRLVAAIQDTPYGSEALITDRERFEREYPDIVLDPVDFDEMMVLLCRGQKL